MKNWGIALLAGIFAVGLLAQEKGESEDASPIDANAAFEEFGSDTSTKNEHKPFENVGKMKIARAKAATPRLTIMTEFIELHDQADLNAWIGDPANSTDGPEFRKYVSGLQKSDKATLLDMSLVAASNGEDAQVESADWYFYISSLDSPEISTESGETIVPAAYQSCELRQVGPVSRFCPSIWPGGVFSNLAEPFANSGKGDPAGPKEKQKLTLAMAPQFVEWVGESSHGKKDAERKDPVFRTLQVSADIEVKDGEPSLIGVVNRDGDDSERPVLVFVRADLHEPKKEGAK